MKTHFRIFVLSVLVLSFSTLRAQNEFSSGVIQVGVVVTDLEKSVDFYTNVVGMVQTGGFEVNADFGKKSGLSDGVPFKVAMMKLQDSEAATQWKLMSFDKKAGHKTPKFIQDDTGIQYVTINVTAMKPFLERIKNHNVKLLGETPVPLGAKDTFVLIQDPDGTFIELIGPME